MNKFVVLLVLATAWTGNCDVKDFQSIFKKCKKDASLNECLTKAVNKGWPKFVKTYNLDKIPFETYQNIPFVFEGWFKNCHLEGFENITFNQFYVDFKKKTFDIIYSQPRLSVVVGDYELLGNFLGVKFYDHGQGNGTFFNGVNKFHFDYDIEERDGEQFMKLTTFKLTNEADTFFVNLKSQVSEEQGTRIASLFNDYFRIFYILSESYISSFVSEAYTPIIQNFLDQIPMKSLFK